MTKAAVAALLDALNDDELAVLAEVATGLVRGREVYGPLQIDADARDFKREAADELRDCLVYIGAELMRLRRLRR